MVEFPRLYELEPALRAGVDPVMKGDEPNEIREIQQYQQFELTELDPQDLEDEDGTS